MKNNNSSSKNKGGCGIDLLQVFIVIVGALVIYYIYRKHNQDVETFIENELSNKKIGDLTDKELQALCNPKNHKIQGYRSLYSGATFKFEAVGEISENKFYLHGPPYKVVTVDVGNSLTLKAKNEVDASKQIFTKVEKVIDNNKCLIFTIGDGDSKLALQYEHEHLSLRPLNGDKPFMGQCFVKYEGASVKEIDANALSLGISVPKLGNEYLAGSGHNNVISNDTTSYNNSNGASSSDNSSTQPTVSSETTNTSLQDLTKAQFQELMQKILKDVKIYDEETGNGKPGDQNVFALGDEGITVNVNLSKQGDETDTDTFVDLKGDNKSSSVRALLDKYTKSKKGTSFLEEVEKSGDLQSVNNVLRNKFKGCPGFDRRDYYTERQIAQCSGCSPDNFLRGKL